MSYMQDDEDAFGVFSGQPNGQPSGIEAEQDPADNNSQMNEEAIPDDPQFEVIPGEAAKEVKTDYKLEGFEIERIKEDVGCHHEIIRPKDWEAHKRPPKPPAREYKFTLDPFQKKAVECIDNGESVLVAAHTSAGKTAVAEYAIATALRDKQRVIYTSPIKALSNQKYRELREIFQDVGLITGDVTQNQSSSCLVMTTEILRSMLYRGSEIAKEISWVIFDEVHYMRDRERGVVWEETMILCSPNIRYVFLSATIPNASEFAEWICRIKRQPCHVVYTDFRPVPLQHFIFPSGGKGLHLIVDEKGQFREENFKKALSIMNSGVENFVKDQKKVKKSTDGSDLNEIIRVIIDRKLNPVIVFSFNKREVEGYATSMQRLDLTSDEEKDIIESMYTNAMSSLGTEDRELPQIQQMVPILKRGIGIHHGGLLPIVKEIIEILFSLGLLKILFSTETFSMGLNMPAKTVVFTSARKFDGENFRWLAGGEYIQMSGRAGRRGLDDRGIAILMVDEKMEPEVAKGMLKGKADPLNSSFHLNYNMLINSMKIEDSDPEYIIRRSFHQFQSDLALPEMKTKLEEIDGELSRMVIKQESEIADIYALTEEKSKSVERVREIITRPEYILPYFSIGRLVRIKNKEADWGWGCVVNFLRKKMPARRGKKEPQEAKFNYLIDVVLYIKPRQFKGDKIDPAKITEDGDVEVIPMLLDYVQQISTLVINPPNDMIKQENKLKIRDTLREIHKTFGDNIPIMDPIKDMKIQDSELMDAMKKIEGYDKKINSVKDKLTTSGLEEQLEIYQKKHALDKQAKFLRSRIEQGSKMILESDLKSMKSIMRTLKLITKDDIVQLKGRVAGEVSSCDELIVTELMFSGFFNNLQPSEIAAIMSCMIHDESGADKAKFIFKNDTLKAAYENIVATATSLVTVYQNCKLNIDEATYLSTFRPQLVEITYKWCEGASFGEICKLTDTYEGSIIRCFRRLEELLKELANCARAIENPELQSKFQAASEKLKRGIVFAASLYIN